jgi:hypothetical protein
LATLGETCNEQEYRIGSNHRQLRIDRVLIGMAHLPCFG